MALTDAAEYLNLTTQSQIRRLHETRQKTRVMNESKEVLNLSNLKKNIYGTLPTYNSDVQAA